MAAEEKLSGSDGEMVASYMVTISGIQRTKTELEKLSLAISSLRKAEYGEGTKGVNGAPDTRGTPVSLARYGKSRGDRLVGKNSTGNDIFASPIIELEGRVQKIASQGMASAMAEGKKIQIGQLRAAETDTGNAGGARKGPGRDKTGAMIAAIRTNVETQKVGDRTTIVGWHGWGRDRSKYFMFQEQGSKGRESGQYPAGIKRKVKDLDVTNTSGVPAANSLGIAIAFAREHLKNSLGKIKK